MPRSLIQVFACALALASLTVTLVAAEGLRIVPLVRDDRVHGTIYTDPAIFEEEMERIFHRGWVFVGHEGEIPSPGDYRTCRLGRQPVIFVRGADGAVRVLMNRCTHRGTVVCP